MQMNHTHKELTVLSMFSGCGGMDLGFRGGFEFRGTSYRKLPFKILAAFDNDKKCIETYNGYFDHDAELLDLGSADLAALPNADVLIGGFPCQDFSSCGPRRGLQSVRGRLYLTLVNYMTIHKPKVVVGENVPHLAYLHDGEVLPIILQDFRDVGYKVDLWTLNAGDYGVPQTRTRLFIVATRNDLPSVPKQPVKPNLQHPISIDWAIGDLANVVDESVPNQSQYFLASRAKNGNGQGDETNTAGNPSYTIRANAKSRVQFHYSLPRRLTIRECARIQTFPDDFIFPHSATANLFQVGNAVPPVLAYYVAKSIKSFLATIND